MKSTLTRMEAPQKEKPYFFCARINANQLHKLNAIMYTSNATHAHFLNSILDVIDWLCRSGQDEILREIAGPEFYARYIENYLENLAEISYQKEIMQRESNREEN